jgi:hypothetical protein
VAVDLRVVNTKTLEVVNTQSLQKQIIGTELNSGYFRLFSDGLADVNAAERTQEPIQKGLRMVIEHAVFQMMAEMNNLPAENCSKLTTAATATHTKKTTPIVLTPPPTANGPKDETSVQIDPYTGEIIRGNSSATTAEVKPQGEATVLKGLFGSSAAPISQEAGDNTRREMQEKLLWGNRPQIR